MHNSAFDSFIKFKKVYLDKIQLKQKIKIIEVGSLSINSNIKPTLDKNKFEYIGLDIEKGPNVDIVLEDPYKFPLNNESVDAVVSISTFEHTDFFWLSYLEILRILKPSGLFFLNVPSNSNFHRHPVDSWRFYPDSSSSLIKWGKKNDYNCECLEHYTNYETVRDIWNDYVSIIIKDKNSKSIFKERIIDNYRNFTNGKTDKDNKFINYNKTPQDQSNWGWKLYYKLRRRLWKIKKKLGLFS